MDQIPLAPQRKSCCYQFGSIMGFVALCFLYGTSYGFAQQVQEIYPEAILPAFRMFFGFIATAIITIFRMIFDVTTRNNIKYSVKTHKMDMLKSAFGGIMYYGFPHSLIGVTQKSIPSNTIHIAQSCVPFFAFIFANFMLADEKFSLRRFYPQVLALIGTILTTIPTNHSDYGGKKEPLHYIFLVVSVASFGFGSVYMKSHLAVCEPTLCGFFQMFGSFVFSACFGLAWNRPSGFMDSFHKTTWIRIIYPIILGAVHTCGCTYVYLWTVKRLGAVISSFSNFGQIVIGILIGVILLNEWDAYVVKDYILSACGLVTLTAAIVCGFISDRKAMAKDESLTSILTEPPESNEPKKPEYENADMQKPLLS